MTFETVEDNFERRIAELEQQVAELKAAQHTHAPIPFTPHPTTHPIKPTCPKCGLCLDGVMSYTCSHIGCPTGLGGLSC